MNFLENLPGGRAGEANRSDPQSGVSRLIPVNVPVPVPVPEKAMQVLELGRPSLRAQLGAARERSSPGTPACHPRVKERRSGTGTGTFTFTFTDRPIGAQPNGQREDRPT
jgi:hypothetical protein